MRIVVTAIGVAALFVCPPLFAQERSQRNGRRIVERFKQLDRNGDGKVTREEARGAPWFDRLDRDGDGVITLDEVQGRSHRPGGGPKAAQAATRSDVAYGEHDAQRLDIYAPKDAKHCPVMVYVHGGGWRHGDKRGVGRKTEFFTGMGWVLVSVNYRLLPDGKHPANVQDVARALAWVHDHIAELGGNPDELFLMGHSAGCHLASLVATDGRHLEKAGKSLSIVKGVIALDTKTYDLPTLMKSNAARFYGPIFGNEKDVLRDASPISHVAADKGIPPFLICYSRGMGKRPDPARRAQAEGFAKALRGAGIPAEVVDASDRNHGEINQWFGKPDDNVTGKAVSFLDGLRKKTGAKPTEKGEKVAVRIGEAPQQSDWSASLTFDPEKKKGPLPVNAMNLVVHRGMLFCGMATSFERDRYSGHSSYIYVKEGADSPWKLDIDFGPATSRVGAMLSARFANDGEGQPIPGGPKDVLVAFTMRFTRRSSAAALQARIRDETTGEWRTVELPGVRAAQPNVRALCLHRDSVTGADLLFVGANPSPLGILTGSYDAKVPGGIRWADEPETTAQSQRGRSKWFGMATVNGMLFASDRYRVYRRVDGPQPKWINVLEFPRVGGLSGAEVRGLTAVPNPKHITGWPEDQVLLMATQFKIWRMRVPTSPDEAHPHEAELDMIPWLSEHLGEPIIFAEAAFNRLRAFRTGAEAPPQWPIGFQVVYPVAGKKISAKDPGSYRLKNDAWFLLRSPEAQYMLQRIVDPRRPDARLFLARDFAPSPFPGEENILYACGYNGSYFKGSLGTAWIYRGTLIGR